MPTAIEQERIVEPGEDPKSGCFWCPLLPFSRDFKEVGGGFQRDAEKILAKDRTSHVVTSRCVSEPWTKVRVLFVGEAPGKHEDTQGKPFVGGSGGLLRKTIAAATGLAPKDYGFANLVSCRPPRNRTPNNTEVKACSPKLLREIAARKPELVVVLGNSALQFLTGQSGITMLNGRVLKCIRPEFPNLKVLACLHPAYVLRYDHELDKFYSSIETAGKILAGTHKELAGEGTYEVLTDIDEVEKRLAAIRKQRRLTAFDTETGGTSPFQTKFPRLLCLSFSSEKNTGFVVPFDHKDAPKEFRTKGPIRLRLKRALRRFFQDEAVPKAAQNGKYDRNHIRSRLGVVPVNVLDTMMLHFVMDEQRGTHGLDKLAFAHTGMGGYDKPLEDYKARHPEADPKRGGSYANIPGEVLFPYAAMDADVTRRAVLALQKEKDFASNQRMQRLGLHFYPRLSDTLADIEWNGATVDPQMVAYLDRRYTKKLAEIDAKIQSDPKVRAFLRDREEAKAQARAGKRTRVIPAPETFNPESWQQLGKVLFGYYGLRPIELNDSGMDLLKHRLEKAVEEWAAKPGSKVKNAKPDFTAQVEAAIANKEWDLFSTKADVLQEYGRMGNPLVQLILDFRANATLQGTFIVPLQTKLDEENRIHGTYLMHGTVTARLASRDPNLQNVPNKGGGLIKRCYVSRFGNEGVILQADYSQIELRVAACLFKEPTMIEAYRRGADLHTLTAIAISKLSPEKFKKLPKDVQKGWRTRAKRVNFGVLYGGGPPALVSTLAKDGVFITVDEAQELIDAYFDARPALKRNMDRLMERVKKLGYLEAFTGHRRRVPEVFSEDEKIVARALRQSVNFPVQCGAAQMTNMSMVLIEQELKRRGLRSKLILTVHDSLVFDCHVDEMVEVGQLAKHIMENLPKLSEEVLPGLDWSWLTVPIIADLEVGFTWGTGVDLKEAKINKDDEPRELDINDLDVDYLWAAMEARQAA
jgi:uracil-DNA glycosylase family 4